MSNAHCFEDAFNMLCGDKLGEGVDREVFACKLFPKFVVKVEHGYMRYFANPLESKFWEDHKDQKAIAKWLAPCGAMSPDGRLLLQERVHMALPGDKMPDKLPAFLTDIGYKNFGWRGNQLVCVDYSRFAPNPSVRLRRAEWPI